MASKIEDKSMQVAIKPYEHGGQAFDMLEVSAGYRKGRGFYVSIHPGWATDWGGFGCLLDFSQDPLTATTWVDVKPATKNSQKTIDQMAANLKQAKDAITWLFDQRNWKELSRLVKDVALCGYTYSIEGRMQELRRYPNSDSTKNTTMAKESAMMKAASKREQSRAGYGYAEHEQARSMSKQFRDLKAKHPDAVLLFRCGDFYESYDEDAVECAKILGITLTKRSSDGEKMAGFPHHALDTYLPRLIRAGKRVAICDQLEDPKLTKRLVKRGITELVSNNETSTDNTTMAKNAEEPTVTDGVKYRPATMAEIEGCDTDLYMNGEQVWVLMINRSQTIGEGESKVDYITLTNMKKVQVEDLQVIDNNHKDKMNINNNQNNESANVQATAQVNNEVESVSVGEVTLDTIMPKMVPVEGTEYQVKDDSGKAVTFSSAAPNIGYEPAKQEVAEAIVKAANEGKATTMPLGSHGSLVIGGVPKRNPTPDPSPKRGGENPSETISRVRLVTFTTKRGDTAPRIVGFTGENDPRWKPIYDEKQRLVAAYNKAKKNDPKAKMTSSPFGPAWLTDRETNEKTYCMTFGVKYMDAAKALCEAYNTNDREAWKQAEQAVRDTKAGIVSGYQAEKAARRAEREAQRAAKAAQEQPAAPAMSSEEQAMFDLFKKFMAGDKEAMAKVNAVLKAA